MKTGIHEVLFMDIYAKLKELVSKQVKKKKFDPETITPDTKLEDLGLDSLDTAELIINIEQEFNLPEVTQDEMMSVKTVKDVKELIEKKRSENK
jgi:acyl carrier protein